MDPFENVFIIGYTGMSPVSSTILKQVFGGNPNEVLDITTGERPYHMDIHRMEFKFKIYCDALTNAVSLAQGGPGTFVTREHGMELPVALNSLLTLLNVTDGNGDILFIYQRHDDRVRFVSKYYEREWVMSDAPEESYEKKLQKGITEMFRLRALGPYLK